MKTIVASMLCVLAGCAWQTPDTPPQAAVAGYAAALALKPAQPTALEPARPAPSSTATPLPLRDRADIAALSKSRRTQLEALSSASAEPVSLSLTPDQSSVAQLVGRFAADTKDPAQAAQMFVERNADALGIDASQLQVELVHNTPRGVRVQLRQVVGGIPVFGGGVSVLIQPDGGIVDVCTRTAAKTEVSTKPSVPAETAADLAQAALGVPRAAIPPASLVLFDGANFSIEPGVGTKLAWSFELAGPDLTLHAFVDASDGNLLQQYTVVTSDPDSDNGDCPFESLPFYYLNEATGVPDFITFAGAGLWLPESAHGDPAAVALSFFRKHPQVFGTGDVPNQLVVSKVEQEGTPVYATHVSLQQMYGGLPVFGATLQVHLNPALAITSIGGRYVRDPRVVPQARVSEQAAADTAIRMLRSERAAQGITDDPARELKTLGLYVYPAVLRGDPHLHNAVAYRFQFADVEVFVGDGSGEQVAAVVAVHPQQASVDRIAMDAGGASQLSFPARVAVNGVAAGSGPLSADAAAVDPLANVALSMFTRFGRDSYDGRGSDVVAVTNSSLALTGGCGARAQWDFVRNWVWFCPGNVVGDVLTHELGHGVATTSAFLLPIDETGALGEHYGDVFGALAFPDPGGLWQIGESLPGGMLRDMVTDPPLNYSGFVPRGAGCTAPEDVFKTACDGGHVHTNCAIGNHAAVFLADGDGVPGSAHPGIGRDRLGRLFLATLTHRMHPWSTYIDERLNTWQAARDLGAAGVQVANTAIGSGLPSLLPFDGFVAAEVGWAFNRVGVDPRLIAGWFSVPVGVSGGSGTITYYGGQMLPACSIVSDIELQVRVFDPFGQSLPWWTGSSRLSGSGGGAVTFPGGIFGAAITASAVGTSDKSTTVRYFHSGFLPVDINVVIIPAQDPACAADGGTDGGIILPEVSEFVSSGTTHWSFAVGGKGDDNLNTVGLMMREPNLGKGCPITDAFVELLGRDGTVLGTSSLGGPPVVQRYGLFDAFSFGAQLTAADINTTNPAATVHWWFDVGSAVRYQVRYFATGSSCSIQ